MEDITATMLICAVIALMDTLTLFLGIWLGYRMATIAKTGRNPVPAVFGKKAASAKAYTETDGRSMDADDPDATDMFGDVERKPEEMGVGL